MRINGFLKLGDRFEIGTILHESQINYLSMCQTSGEMTAAGTFSSMSGAIWVLEAPFNFDILWKPNIDQASSSEM